MFNPIKTISPSFILQILCVQLHIQKIVLINAHLIYFLRDLSYDKKPLLVFMRAKT